MGRLLITSGYGECDSFFLLIEVISKDLTISFIVITKVDGSVLHWPLHRFNDSDISGSRNYKI